MTVVLVYVSHEDYTYGDSQEILAVFSTEEAAEEFMKVTIPRAKEEAERKFHEGPRPPRPAASTEAYADWHARGGKYPWEHFVAAGFPTAAFYESNELMRKTVEVLDHWEPK